jgi:hypothetical protein
VWVAWFQVLRARAAALEAEVEALTGRGHQLEDRLVALAEAREEKSDMLAEEVAALAGERAEMIAELASAQALLAHAEVEVDRLKADLDAAKEGQEGSSGSMVSHSPVVVRLVGHTYVTTYFLPGSVLVVTGHTYGAFYGLPYLSVP